MTSVRCNDDVIITTIYYAAASYTHNHAAPVYFCLISHVFLFYNSWPCSYTPSRAFTFHRHVSSRSTDTCLHTLHALRCSRTFIFICCRCSFKLQARARVTSPVNSYALLCFWFTCWWSHVFYASFALILQGYEGSLLKVTGKNGKSTSVSARPESPVVLRSQRPENPAILRSERSPNPRFIRHFLYEKPRQTNNAPL